MNKRINSQHLPTTPSRTENIPISIFIAYAYKDRRLLEKIEQIIATLSKQDCKIAYRTCEVAINAEWRYEVEELQDISDLILLLISPDFIATEYCYSELLKRAIQRHRQGGLVIPVLLRSCSWRDTPFAGLSFLPKNGEAVTKWTRRDDAFQDIAEGIRKALQYIRDRL